MIRARRIIQNIYRFSGANTARRDGTNRAGQLTGDGKFGFDCSGFVWYILNKSGFRIENEFSTSSIFSKKDTLSPAGSGWQQKIDASNVQAGDLVWFAGRVGFVVSFDAAKGTGVFRSATGSNNDGAGIEDAQFQVGTGSAWWGGAGKPFFGFTRVTTTYRPGGDNWEKCKYGVINTGS